VQTDAHQIAREMAPTYSHTQTDEVELGSLVMQVVGGAIRDRLGHRKKGEVEGGEKKSKKKGSKGSKRPSPSSSRPSSDERAHTSSSVSSGSHTKGGKQPSVGGGGGGGGGGDAGRGSASRESEIRTVLADVLRSLAGYDSRLALPLFSQQVVMLNARFGQPSNQSQIDALFGACQVAGYVDFADFLGRESTARYFLMDRPADKTYLSA